MEKMKNKYDVGVVIGRFQVPELSVAHKKVIRMISENHKQTIVFIGVAATLGTKRNPLGYTERMLMIREEFPNVIISHVMDTQSDIAWSKCIDKTIRAICPLGSVCLYGGRDSFVGHYHGSFDVFELAKIPDSEGTDIREDTGKQPISSVDFRKGIIYSCQNQYPKVYPTIDIAVLKDKDSVLLGRRTKDSKLRFFGGFVDPTDKGLEYAALRELSEEVDVETDKELTYIGSFNIDDWRYYGSERIITTLFATNYLFGSGKPITEFHSTEIIKLSYDNLPLIEGEHKKLFEALVLKQTKKRNKTKGDLDE